MPDVVVKPKIKKEQLKDWFEVDAAAKAASDANVLAGEAKTASETAATKANEAKTASETATTKANLAKTASETAATKADAAKTASDTATSTANDAQSLATKATLVANAKISHFIRPEKEITQADFEVPGGEELGGTITLESITSFSVLVSGVAVMEIGDVEVIENGVIANKPTITMSEDADKNTTITVSGLNNVISVDDLFVVKLGIKSQLATPQQEETEA